MKIHSMTLISANDGEILNSELGGPNQGPGRIRQVVSATATTVVDNYDFISNNYLPFLPNLEVAIISGPGKTQVRKVISLSSNGTMEVDKLRFDH